MISLEKRYSKINLSKSKKYFTFVIINL